MPYRPGKDPFYMDQSPEDEQEVLITPFQASAYRAHEMYLALQQAGFTPQEALWLVGRIITAGHG